MSAMASGRMRPRALTVHFDHGKWMLSSKKVDGKWLTECDIFNSDMAMPSGAMK
jgi:hypothetical protein